MSEAEPRVSTFADVTGDFELDCDAVVVGSGCGGATFASEFAEAGRSVVLFEQGSHRTAAEFNGLELDMYGRLYADNAATGPDDLSSAVLYGRTVGGSSVHYMANSFRVPEWRLAEWRSRFGLSLTREVLDPLYAIMEERHGVHRALPEETNRNNEVLIRGARALGWSVEPVPHARKSCANAGYCLLGCPFDRKQSQLLTHVPRALAFGARIHADARVDEILVEGGAARGVRGTVVDPVTGGARGRFTARAPHVVLAAGGVGTPWLLLRQKLANSSGQVGRNFLVTPHLFVFAEMEQRIEGWVGLPTSYAVMEWLARRPSGEGGYAIQAIFAQPGFVASLLPGLGPEHSAIMDRFPFGAGAISFLDDEEPGRVSYRAHRPKIDYHLRGRDVAKAKDFFKKTAELFLAAGAKRALVPDVGMTWIGSAADLKKIDRIDFTPGRVPWVGTTNCSTCRMGADPKSSVVAETGETHDVKGLYVVDASWLPTTPAVDPSLTIMANAYRVAHGILAGG